MQRNTQLMCFGGASILHSRAELSLPLSAACNEMLPLKPKHFPPGLFTNGSYVRIRTGEPVCFSNGNTRRECCESAKQMKIQLDAQQNESCICFHLFTSPFNSRNCAAADILQAVMAHNQAWADRRASADAWKLTHHLEGKCDGC